MADLALCAPWAEVADAVGDEGCPGCGAGLDEDALEAGLLDASAYLHALSGWRYPGVCEATARPCSGDENCGVPSVPPGDHPDYAYHLDPYRCWGCGDTCCGPIGVTLGVAPVISVTEVKVDGAVVTADKWELVDDVLVRTDGEAWPHCQDRSLPDTEPGTFAVDFTWGAAPPSLGVRAAIDLGCVLAKAACGDAGCQPVAGIVRKTAGGVTKEFPALSAELLSTMPRSVRMFLDAFGTGHRQGPVLRRPAARRPAWAGRAGCPGCR